MRTLTFCVIANVVGFSTQLEAQQKQDPMWQNSVCRNPVMTRTVISKRLEGHVTALYDISADGQVENIRIIESAPNNNMDYSVKRALSRWRYFLHFENGIAAPRKDVSVTFTFGEDQQEDCRHTALPDLPSSAGNPNDPYVQLKQCFKLVMPQSAARDKTGGVASIGYDIESNGNVNNVQLTNSSSIKLLDEHALTAVKRWKYHEFKETGKAIARPGMTVQLYFGDLPKGAPNNACSFADWNATNIIQKVEIKPEKPKPGVKTYNPSRAHGKKPTPN